uniref:Uncharacterized protein n=1 Tax=Rhodopseudomonas palustris (strain BisA53) TaxID=316055 RepID=Q07LC6_RHOP5
MRRLLLKAAVLMGALSLGGGSAPAMPLGGVLHAPAVTQADWQCGRGWHVTAWGDCRPDRRLDYRFSSWPYRYDGYRAYDWTYDHGRRHDHPWQDDDAPRGYDWTWDE